MMSWSRPSTDNLVMAGRLSDSRCRSFQEMAGLPHDLLLDLPISQANDAGSKRKDSRSKHLATVLVGASQLDVSSLGIAIVSVRGASTGKGASQ